jgi:protein phosphatase
MIPGTDNRQEADIVHITDIQSGDYFFICSDGVLEKMDDEGILDWLSEETSDEEKCKKLVEMTKENDDNHSAYLVHVDEVISEEGDADLLNDEQTVRFNAINIHPVLQERNDDDVKIVDRPVNTKKMSTMWTVISMLVLLVLAVILVAFLLGK